MIRMIIRDELPTRIAILCGEPAFQQWLVAHVEMPPNFADSLVAAEIVRQICGISSRRDLANNAAARAKALELIADYERSPAPSATTHVVPPAAEKAPTPVDEGPGGAAEEPPTPPLSAYDAAAAVARLWEGAALETTPANLRAYCEVNSYELDTLKALAPGEYAGLHAMLNARLKALKLPTG